MTDAMKRLDRMDMIIKSIMTVIIIFVAAWLISSNEPNQSTPEVTPDDQLEFERLETEINSIRKELEEIQRLMKLRNEGKLWSA